MENAVFLLPQPLCKTQWASLALLPLALQQAPSLFFPSPKISFLCSHKVQLKFLICPASKRHHKPVDEQRTEHVSQENSRMPGPAQPPCAREQSSSHRERGLQKESKMWLVDIHIYTIVIYPHPTTHPFLKINIDFLSPETELLEVHLVQAELTKSNPLSFFIKTDKATDCCGHLCVPWHTQRQQHPTGILLHHLPSLLLTTPGKWAWFPKDTGMIQKIFESVLVSSPSTPRASYMASHHPLRGKNTTINCPQPFNMRETNKSWD